MIKFLVIIIFVLPLFIISYNPIAEAIQKNGKYPVELDDQFWKETLSEEQYSILIESNTDPAFNNKYYYNKSKGLYVCAGCGNFLFDSATKYSSGSGWPSFYDVYSKQSIQTRPDNSHGMNRTETICASCGGHLGHLFEDGPEPTGLRYCINSSALKFYNYAYFAHG